MNGEQRYLLDLQGYLHIRGALAADELGAAQRAADRVVAAEAAGSLPDGAILEKVGESYSHYDKAFTVEKDLEALVFHPSFWPVVFELTDGKPALRDGVLIVDDHRIARQATHPPRGGTLHCAREDWGRGFGARFDSRDGRIYCDNFVVFIYLDAVLPGDGGLAVLPGSQCVMTATYTCTHCCHCCPVSALTSPHVLAARANLSDRSICMAPMAVPPDVPALKLGQAGATVVVGRSWRSGH